MIIDFILFIYCWIGALKGRKRKLSEMLYRFIRNTTATISGVSLYRWIGNLIRMFLSNFLANSLGFVFAFILSFIIIRKFKRKLTIWIDTKLEEAEQSKWGAMVGFLDKFCNGIHGHNCCMFIWRRPNPRYYFK